MSAVIIGVILLLYIVYLQRHYVNVVFLFCCRQLKGGPKDSQLREKGWLLRSRPGDLQC